MRVFVIRPFGTKEGIDFDRVDEVLIQPALRKLETREDPISGGTTGLISRQGNIREDMFRMIVASDLVIADVSIHNANAFYELGIRHALRPRRAEDVASLDVRESRDRDSVRAPAARGSRFPARRPEQPRRLEPRPGL